MTIKHWFNEEVFVNDRVAVGLASTKEEIEGKVVMKDDNTFTIRDDEGICRVIVTDDLDYYEVQ